MASTTPSKVISPQKLAHIVLRTSPENFKTMRDFYLTFLGAKVAYENDMLSFLTYDDEHHRIALAAIPGTKSKDKHSCGLEHIAFTFPNLSELLQAYSQRKEHGITPIWTVNHGPTMSLYYQDPDGNQIETQVDTFETSEEASAFMASPEFAQNPYGVDFDPEEVIEKLRQGVPEQEFLKRSYIGTRDITSIPWAVLA